ncbi:MAG TPA: hypothetical protein VN373_00460, partial [Methanosarcina barkeri]|nr:hypothetical protein [Methanosarcina barkeri]
LYYHTEQLYHQNFKSIYEYDITLDTNSELKNVTFYLPLPIYENESASGNELVSRYLQEKDGWNLSLVDTENGKMLALRADIFVPEMHSPPVAISDTSEEINGTRPVGNPEPDDEIQGEELQETGSQVNSSENMQFATPLEFRGELASDSEINTKFPLGNEPVLNPAYNPNLSTYDLPYSENKEPPTVYNYDSLIYADYETSPDAHVSMTVHFSGRNEWWIYGWNWNQYYESIYADFNGPQQGWVPVKGKITMGDGNYR